MDADGVCAAHDICPGGDDELDFDADGWPDACDICPEDPMDLCWELPIEECADRLELGPGPGECPEACRGAYESAGFPRVYEDDPADCPDCAQSFSGHSSTNTVHNI